MSQLLRKDINCLWSGVTLASVVFCCWELDRAIQDLQYKPINKGVCNAFHFNIGTCVESYNFSDRFVRKTVPEMSGEIMLEMAMEPLINISILVQ